MATTTKTRKNSSPAKSKSNAKGSKGKTSRCWAGYEPTPGSTPGAKGSCKPKK